MKISSELSSLATMAMMFGVMSPHNNGEWVLQTPKRVTSIPPNPRGTLFVFDDGFRCYALNQKNADRKHKRFLSGEKSENN
jgi:hypothetical protein